MKKIISLIIMIMLVGCTKKADLVCTEENELYTTKVELNFKNDKLEEAISISEYKDEELANQICNSLGDKVKCYKNKVQINDYMKDYLGNSKYTIQKELENQGFNCK